MTLWRRILVVFVTGILSLVRCEAAEFLVTFAASEEHLVVEANHIIEIQLASEKNYLNPFKDVELDAVVEDSTGTVIRVPGFWGGGLRWCFRYASGLVGKIKWKTECSDKSNSGLHGISGTIQIIPYRGNLPTYRHGPLRMSEDRRHFAHTDGTPFFWLGDTWWKGLCKRMSWDGFQELAADRKAKGFTVVQIVCGPYPDEGMFESRWENESGGPYHGEDFSEVNPAYFDAADRRLGCLVEMGIVPAIVGGWGREQAGGKSTIAIVGIDGYRRHWRNLIARYGAFPVVWILGGEASDRQGPWAELSAFVKETDPFHRLLTYHAQGHPRQAIQQNSKFDFDTVAIGHNGFETANQTLEMVASCRNSQPIRPVLCGEACYEGHMQTNFQDMQRYLFWSLMLSGAAGHTYGAAGIWHASVEGDPGIDPIYDFTTWKEGMNYPGSAQLGIGKRLLALYPWERFEPHPEWVETGCFAGGIPREVRIIYLPRRNIYNWSGPTVFKLEASVDWHAYYFDPATGRKFDRGILKAPAKSGEEAAKTFDFKQNVPSPQDWVLVVEKAGDKSSQ